MNFIYVGYRYFSSTGTEPPVIAFKSETTAEKWVREGDEPGYYNPRNVKKIRLRDRWRKEGFSE